MLWERLGELREPGSFPAWLLRICRSLAHMDEDDGTVYLPRTVAATKSTAV